MKITLDVQEDRVASFIEFISGLDYVTMPFDEQEDKLLLESVRGLAQSLRNEG